MQETSSQGPQVSSFHQEGFNSLYFHVNSEQHVYVCSICVYVYACVCTYMYMSQDCFLRCCPCISLMQDLSSESPAVTDVIRPGSHCLCLPSIGLPWAWGPLGHLAFIYMDSGLDSKHFNY